MWVIVTGAFIVPVSIACIKIYVVLIPSIFKIKKNLSNNYNNTVSTYH